MIPLSQIVYFLTYSFISFNDPFLIIITEILTRIKISSEIFIDFLCFAKAQIPLNTVNAINDTVKTDFFIKPFL